MLLVADKRAVITKRRPPRAQIEEGEKSSLDKLGGESATTNIDGPLYRVTTVAPDIAMMVPKHLARLLDFLKSGFSILKEGCKPIS